MPSSSIFISLPLSSTSDAHPDIPAHNLVAITQKELTQLKWEGQY